MKRPMGPVVRDDHVWDLCDCKATPMMAWHVDGMWVAVYAVDADRDAKADATEYRAVKANAWMIGCPECGRVYARGIS